MLTSRLQEMVQVGSSPQLPCRAFPTTRLLQANCYTCAHQTGPSMFVSSLLLPLAIALTTHADLLRLSGVPRHPTASVMPV
jgi:hypothetical protein